MKKTKKKAAARANKKVINILLFAKGEKIGKNPKLLSLPGKKTCSCCGRGTNCIFECNQCSVGICQDCDDIHTCDPE